MIDNQKFTNYILNQIIKIENSQDPNFKLSGSYGNQTLFNMEKKVLAEYYDIKVTTDDDIDKPKMITVVENVSLYMPFRIITMSKIRGCITHKILFNKCSFVIKHFMNTEYYTSFLNEYIMFEECEWDDI